MSNNSDETRLQNRLESLFSDLDQPTDIPGFSTEDNPRGWIWEIDHQGILTASSPEIEIILGFTKQALIGKSLSQFSDFVLDNAGLEKAQASVNYPVHIEIAFDTESGGQIKFHVQIFARDDEDGNLLGWRGIALRLDGYQPLATEDLEIEQEKALAASVTDTFLEFEDIPAPDAGDFPPIPETETKFPSFLEDHKIPQEESGEFEPEEIKAQTFHDDAIDPDPGSHPQTIEEQAPSEQVESPDLAETQLIQPDAGKTPLPPIEIDSHLDDSPPAEETFVSEISEPHLETPAPIPSEELIEPFVQDLKDSTDTEPLVSIPAIEQEAPITFPVDEIPKESTSPIPVELSGEQDWIPGGGPSFGETSPDVKGDNLFDSPETGEDPPSISPSSITDPSDSDVIPTFKDSGIEIDQPIADLSAEISGPDVLPNKLQFDPSVDTADHFLDQIELEDHPAVEEEPPAQQDDQHPHPASVVKTSPLLIDEERFAELDEIHAGIDEPPREEHAGSPEPADGLGEEPLPAEQESTSPLQFAEELKSTQMPSTEPALLSLDTTPLVVDEEDEARLLKQIFKLKGDPANILNIIDDDPDRNWTEDETLLVQQVSEQLALALENANLFQQTQNALAETDEQAYRLRLLNEMSEELSQADSLQEIYDLALEKTFQIFKADRVSLALMTATKDAVRIVSALGEQSALEVGSALPLEGTANKTAIDENRVIINPAMDEPTPGSIQSFILAPIAVSNEVLGTLNIGSFTPNKFTEDDRNFIAQLLSLLGSIIENRRLFEAIEDALATTEEQARRLSQLNLLSEQLSLANTFDEVINVTMSNVDKIVPVDHCSVAIYNQPLNSYQVIAQQGINAPLPSGELLPVENTLIGISLNENRIRSENNLGETSYVDTNALVQIGIHSLIVAPLSTGGKPIGSINVGKKEAFSYSTQEENLMLSISSLVASTIDNRQLFSQIQRRSAQLETSAEVSRIASTILDTNELLPRAVELIREGYGLYYVGLFLVDQTGEWTGQPNFWTVLRAGTGSAGEEMLKASHKLEIGGDSMIGAAVANSEARIALDVGTEARFFRNPNLPNTRSEMALPLVSRGQVLGALSIQSEKETAFTDEDITALQTMADQVANTIENARLFEQTETRAEELTVLNEMARAYTQSFDVDQIIELTYRFIGRLMDAANFYLALYDPNQDLIEFKLYAENGTPIPIPQSKLDHGDSLASWIINNKLPVLIPNNVEGHLQELGVEVHGQVAKSWLGVPMLRGDQVLGVLAVQNYTLENSYSNHDLDMFSAVASQATVAIDNARRFQETQARAEQERLVRTITDKVRRGSDTQSIMRIALEELSQVLDTDLTTIRIGTRDQLLKNKSNPQPQLDNPNANQNQQEQQ